MTTRSLPAGRAGDLIRQLNLAPHPEGGWYRETSRAPSTDGARPASTAILFLLAKGENSRWHKVDADEIWLHHDGAPLALAHGNPGAIKHVQLGSNHESGETPQAVVPAGAWQAAYAREDWSLASCVVAPGFAFEGFTLAAPNWAPDGGEDFLPNS
ncbi:MAG: cupin domain-containing protein [Alphaproteobacteria bacterium]